MIGHVAATLVGLAGLVGAWLAWTGRWFEDRIRQEAVVERLAGDQIRRVERLPRGTREGGRRARDMRTLTNATLRIEAGAESWIVETAHAKRP